ncbi:MAG: TolC family protein [Chlorobia bacterium]|nr:TolC family protein [Fimbriimonadaceae bacterium]
MKPYIVLLVAFASVHLAQSQENKLSLDRALALARANRPSISAAQLRVKSARLLRKSMGAFPATRLSVGYTSDPAVGGSDDDLVLTQPLDFFGRTSTAIAVGNAGILRAEAELQQVVAEIQAEVVDTYSEAAAAKALAESAVQSQDIAQRLADAMKILVEEGRAAGVQLMRVNIEVERSRLAANQRNAEYRASLERLSGLLAVPVNQVAVPGFAEIQVELIEPAALPRNRFDLLLLAADVRAAEADVRVARLSSLPELEIQGRRSAWQDRDSRYGARIQLNIPLFDYGRSRAETNAAKTKTEAANRALADATRIAESELSAARIELTGAQEQLQRYQTILDSARKLVDISTVGFKEKAITLVELLEGTRALREVEEGFVEARLRLAKAQARYLRASGRILELQP